MSGAIAGSAILYAPKESAHLHTVTLTVNNACNLRCAHCYLQYKGAANPVSREILDAVYRADFKHLAIVGKEPCLHPQLLEEIVSAMNQNGKTVSIITNGTNLHALSEKTLQGLKYIDVSFDGGPKTYGVRRIGDYNRIIENIRRVQSDCHLPVNALHTLYRENLADIDDMVAISDEARFDHVLFSLYKETQNFGKNQVFPADVLDEVLPALARSTRFRTLPNARLLIGKADIFNETMENIVLEKIHELGLKDKVVLDSTDPLLKGFIRVNYDGTVVTPLDSLHPRRYVSASNLLDSNDLSGVFASFQKRLA